MNVSQDFIQGFRAGVDWLNHELGCIHPPQESDITRAYAKREMMATIYEKAVRGGGHGNPES